MAEKGLGLVMRPDLTTRQVGMDLAIYDPETDRVHVLNATAAAMLQHVTPHREMGEIALNIALGFDDDSSEDSVRPDVERLMKELDGLKLFERAEPARERREQAALTEEGMSKVPARYFGPTVTTFEREVMLERFGPHMIGVAKFCDTWVPDVAAY